MDTSTMTLAPVTISDLQEQIRAVHSRGEKISNVNLSRINGLVEHSPEDMTATVQGGLSLAALQSLLQRKRQWLPIDPPAPERLTISELISTNQHGPRRYGHGTIRDHLIGISVVLPSGELIKAGGKVVKNVAGYDLCKLFIGSRDSLGIIVEATFKLKPLPEAEAFTRIDLPSYSEAERLLEKVMASDLTPTVCDLHNIHEPESASGTPPCSLVLGFSGAREDVDYQLQIAEKIGINRPSNLNYEALFWKEASLDKIHHASVGPSDLTSTLSKISASRFVARAGNGFIWYEGGTAIPKPPQPQHLFQRVKATFDPKKILPEFAA